jgi:soluble lytic murein transglycosylase
MSRLRYLAGLVLGTALLSGLLSSRAAAQDIPSLLRANQWAAADAAAARYADPVARKIVLWQRLITPHAAGAGEIAAFIADSPDWPMQTTLALRRDQALLTDPDDNEVRLLCPEVVLPSALLRCADAFDAGGQSAQADDDRRRAWLAGVVDSQAEARFMQRYATVITQQDQWERFGHLINQDAAAKRQLARLDPAHRQAGEAVLALIRDDPRAAAQLARVSPSLRDDPLLVLEQASWLRKSARYEDALTLWRTEGPAAQANAGPELASAYWAERQLLARHLLATGDAGGAYALVAGHGAMAPEATADAEFLAGWIALRRTNDFGAAQAHFRRLAAVSNAAITQGRAHYWLARALAAAGDTKTAQSELQAGARWLTTYYGQLSALALGNTPAELTHKLADLHDPAWQPADVFTYAGHELARAAALLAGWGDDNDARIFLLRLEDLTPSPADRAMTARLAAGLGMLPQSIAIARRAGTNGVMLPEVGWPSPYQPPQNAVEPSLALAVMRQESNFNQNAVSPAGALGLMQLMPATAAEVAQQVGLPASTLDLMGNTDANMRLGSTYLNGLLNRFDGSIPLAIAGYNAGPGRVRQWLAENGDPRTSGSVDMIDWIELIPVAETRNYVQRVVENLEVYRARSGTVLPYPVLQTETQVAQAPSRG